MMPKGTEGKTWDLEPVWVGLGYGGSILRGGTSKAKAVLIYSVPTPGGQDYSAGWSGAVERARRCGRGCGLHHFGVPRQSREPRRRHAGVRQTHLRVGHGRCDHDPRNDGKGRESPIVHVNESVEFRTGLTTNSVWGTLPGTTDENIVIMAHTEAPMQGAMDNASGIGTMIELAQYYASTAEIPAQTHHHVPDDVRRTTRPRPTPASNGCVSTMTSRRRR